MRKILDYTAAGVGLSLLFASAYAEEPVTCIDGQKAQISQAEKVRRGLIEEREVEATPGYPMQFYDNARGHAGWWSDQCGNDDTIMVSIQFPEGAHSDYQNALHNQLVDYVLKAEKFPNVEFFYQDTDNEVGILRTSYEGVTSDPSTFTNGKATLAKAVGDAKNDMLIESKSISELEELARP